MGKWNYSFDAIGTHWSIDVEQAGEPESRKILEEKVQATIEAFDKKYSRFRGDSLVATMASSSGKYILPPDAKALVDLYQKLYHLTDGLVTPLVGNLLSDAGYDKTYSFQKKQLQSPPVWEDALLYKFPDLFVKMPVTLDFGACGKGYLIDQVADLLEHEGVTTYCVDAGGDMRQRGEEALRIGLEHPEDLTQVLGVANLQNKSLCGSAGNRRAWGEFHHIMNPKTRESVEEIKAVWVIADTTLLADGLATALFFIPPEKLLEEFTFDYVVVKKDYTVQQSFTFPGEVFYT